MGIQGKTMHVEGKTMDIQEKQCSGDFKMNFFFAISWGGNITVDLYRNV